MDDRRSSYETGMEELHYIKGEKKTITADDLRGRLVKSIRLKKKSGA
jgi:hypothetical protein